MDELLEKVIVTGADGLPAGSSAVNAAGGGILGPKQADRFIDYMWDSTTLAGQVNTIRMRETEQEFETIGVGTRLMRLATEAVDDGVNVGVAFTKISITTKKLRLDYELSSESLEDNLEGEALEDHIARLMANQAGVDLEDVSINGDTTLTADPLLKAFDGWNKRAKNGGHVLDLAGDTIDRGVFHKALKQMPRKYMVRRPDLRFFVGSNHIQDWLFSVQTVTNEFVQVEAAAAAGLNSTTVPDGPAGFNAGAPFGVPLVEVPLFLTYDTDPTATTENGGDLWLTFPKNLMWGVKREIQVFREFKPKKDTIEYTMYTRVGTQIENKDAFVVVTNIAYEP